MELPPKTVEIVRLELSPEEREFYEALKKRSKVSPGLLRYYLLSLVFQDSNLGNTFVVIHAQPARQAIDAVPPFRVWVGRAFSFLSLK